LVVVAVPLKVTVCGLPDALSVTEIVPVTLPAVVGMKVTLMVQLAAEMRADPWQLSLSAKFVVAVTLVMFSAVVP